MLHNTGQSLVFLVNKDEKQHVNISGGPLAYRYQFEEIYIHYGTENQQGSEHHIHGYSFPGEVSLKKNCHLLLGDFELKLSVIFSLTDFFLSLYFSHRNSNVLIDRSMSTCPELSGNRKYKFLLVSIKFRSELDHYVSCFQENSYFFTTRKKSFIKADGFVKNS